MFGCVFEMRMCLLIWILSCWCLVSSQKLRLSSFPSRPLPGHNVTLICHANFDISSDSIIWIDNRTTVLYTQNSAAHSRVSGILTGWLLVSTSCYYHNLTYTFNTGDTSGPWTCKSNPKNGLTSNELYVVFESITSTRTSSSMNTVPVKHILHRSTTNSVRISEQTSHSVNVSSDPYVSTTSGQGSNVTSGLTKHESNEGIYIAVGSSVGVAVLITVIAIIVCCIVKRNRRDKDEDKVIEENVLYVSSSSCEESEGHMSQVGPRYASINKTKHISTEGVNMDDLYAKISKPKPGDIGGNLEELYAKPNKTRKQVV